MKFECSTRSHSCLGRRMLFQDSLRIKSQQQQQHSSSTASPWRPERSCYCNGDMRLLHPSYIDLEYPSIHYPQRDCSRQLQSAPNRQSLQHMMYMLIRWMNLPCFQPWRPRHSFREVPMFAQHNKKRKLTVQQLQLHGRMLLLLLPRIQTFDPPNSPAMSCCTVDDQ